MKIVIKQISLVICFLAILSCNCNQSSWILYRMASEYFPLSVGNRWVYRSGDEFKFVEVRGETVINGLPAFIIEDDERHEFWSMNEGIIKKLIQKYIVIAGHEYLLKKEWVLQYHVPFLQGNVWGDYVRDTINLLGQLFFFEYIVIRKIVGIEDITTPAGSFIEAYKLDFFEKFTLNDETEIYQGTEWFAPNVGLVKKIINGEEEVLIEYKITNK